LSHDFCVIIPLTEIGKRCLNLPLLLVSIMNRNIDIIQLIENAQILQWKLDNLFHGKSLHLGIEVLPVSIQKDILKDILKDTTTALEKYQSRVHMILHRPDLLIEVPSEQALINISQVLRLSSMLLNPDPILATSNEYTQITMHLLRLSEVQKKLWPVVEHWYYFEWKHKKELYEEYSSALKKDIVHFLEPFRHSHHDWFFIDKQNHTEWYHPYLIAALQEYLGDTKRVRKMPSGWTSGTELQMRFNISKKRLVNLRKNTSLFQSEWVQQFSKHPWQFFLGYAPKCIEKLAEFLLPYEDWVSFDDIEKKYNKSHHTIFRHLKEFTGWQAHYKKYYIDGKYTAYISAECLRWLDIRLSRKGKPKIKSSLLHEIPKNWTKWSDLIQRFKLDERQFLHLRQKTQIFKPEWISKIVDFRWRAILVFSPDFVNVLSKINFPPTGWIPAHVIALKYNKSVPVILRLCEKYNTTETHKWEYYFEWKQKIYVSDEFINWLEKKVETEKNIRKTHKTKKDFLTVYASKHWRKLIFESIELLATEHPELHILSPNTKGNECVYYSKQFEELLIQRIKTKK
jgi:hypothetical protein